MSMKILQCVVAILMVVGGTSASAQVNLESAFTYQGELTENGQEISAQCDFRFGLWSDNNDPNSGFQVGSDLELTAPVSNGVFTVELDFQSAIISGFAKWLNIEVCCPSGCAPGYTELVPRQRISAAPYAVRTRGIYVDESLNVGIGTSSPSPNAMLTVGQNIATFQVGQQPQLYLSKDTVDDKFRVQLTGSGYGGYDLQIGRDDQGHDVILSGDIGIPGIVGIGLTNPSSETKLHINAGANDFGVLVESMGATGSRIGLHAGQANYSSLAKNAYFDGNWKRFNTVLGSFLLEVEPSGDVSAKVAGGGVNADIAWTQAMRVESDGRVVIPVALDIGLVRVDANCQGCRTVQRNCPAGTRLLGGGCSSVSENLWSSRPLTDGEGWYCFNEADASLTAYAICARLD